MTDKLSACGATSHARQVAYLAGPMRGIPEYNFPAFYAAAAALRKHGLDVWSPAENDVNQDGFDPAKDTAQPMRHYMKRDLPAVLDADMVCVLPGWVKSQGARLEVHVARACGIPVYNAHDLSPVSAMDFVRADQAGDPITAKQAAAALETTLSETPCSAEELQEACDIALAISGHFCENPDQWLRGHEKRLREMQKKATLALKGTIPSAIPQKDEKCPICGWVMYEKQERT